MKKIVILLIIIPHLIISQNNSFGKYYKLMNNANYYLNEKIDYSKACKTLDSMLKYAGIPDFNRVGLVVNFNMKKYSSAYSHVLKYATSGNEMSSLINNLNDSSIFKFNKRDFEFLLKKYPDLKTKYTSIQNKAKLKFELDLNNELVQMFYSDQAYRAAYDNLKYSLDSVTFSKSEKVFTKKFIEADSSNFVTFKKIVTKYGLPNRLEVSHHAFSGFLFTLMHNYTTDFGHDYCDSLLKVIKRELNQSYFLTPQEYAIVIDRYYMIKNGMNYYCEFYVPNLTIYEKEKLNDRRAEIFLPLKDIK